MARKAFSIHSDFYEEIRNLTQKNRSDVILALIDWATDTPATIQLDPEISMLFRLMCAQIERISKANAGNGAQGGRPSGKSEESEEKRRKRKKPPVPVTDTVTISNTDTKRKSASALVAQSDLPVPVKDALCDWLAYKQEKRQPYKEKGLMALITTVGGNLEKYGEAAVMACIKESMANNWQGIIWDRIDKTGGGRSVGEHSGGRAGTSAGGREPGTGKRGLDTTRL